MYPHDNGHTEILFTPLVSFETAEALDKICHEYNQIIGNFEVGPLLAIPIFIHDFLCIHPFNDGNGRMSRLLTTLLLYRSGFYVGEYISLEAFIAQNKAAYYEVLRTAGQHWYEDKEDVLPFVKYLLGTILATYKAFEERFTIIEEKLPAMELGRFIKQDIPDLFSSLSISSIEGLLRKLVSRCEIQRESIERGTKYKWLK